MGVMRERKKGDKIYAEEWNELLRRAQGDFAAKRAGSLAGIGTAALNKALAGANGDSAITCVIIGYRPWVKQGFPDIVNAKLNCRLLGDDGAPFGAEFEVVVSSSKSSSSDGEQYEQNLLLCVPILHIGLVIYAHRRKIVPPRELALQEVWLAANVWPIKWC